MTTETETTRFGGPMFYAAESETVRSVHLKRGGHYNTYGTKPGMGMRVLKDIFPEGEANDMNFVLFSTSGVHGSYTTIEQIETGLRAHPDGIPDDADDWPDDYHGVDLTFLVVQPRLVTLTYGEVKVTLDDVPYLKKLRDTSQRAMVKIGMPSEEAR